MKEISFRNNVLPLKNELLRLALRITLNRAEAEDIVQETMIKVWNRREKWEEIESMESFCLTICRNIAIDKTRKAANQNQSLDEVVETPDESHSSNPEAQIIQSDRVQSVRRLINTLPEKQRTAMQLRDFEGKSYKEIATIMAVSEEQVKVNIFRARQAIKKKITESEAYGL